MLSIVGYTNSNSSSPRRSTRGGGAARLPAAAAAAAAACRCYGGGRRRPAQSEVLLHVRQQAARARAVLPAVWRANGASARVKGVVCIFLLKLGLRVTFVWFFVCELTVARCTTLPRQACECSPPSLISCNTSNLESVHLSAYTEKVFAAY